MAEAPSFQFCFHCFTIRTCPKPYKYSDNSEDPKYCHNYLRGSHLVLLLDRGLEDEESTGFVIDSCYVVQVTWSTRGFEVLFHFKIDTKMVRNGQSPFVSKSVL